MGRIKDLPTQEYGLLGDQNECLVIDGERGTRKIPTGRSRSGVIGEKSWAFGNEVYASGEYSHAEGHDTKALSSSCHAEGHKTTAGDILLGSVDQDIAAHAEGYSTTASGPQSHAEGYSTTASGPQSHAEGEYSKASGSNSHAGGYNTITSGSSTFAHGYNVRTNDVVGMAAFGNENAGKADNIFEVGSPDVSGGSGLEIWKGGNAIGVTKYGVVKAASTYQSNVQSDYAEYFEWSDGNEKGEDRVGKFVTFDIANKIRIADQNDEYILGIVSGAPCIVGNGDCDIWTKALLRDEFGRVLYEEAPVTLKVVASDDEKDVIKLEPVLDKDGKQIYEKRPIRNPDYDITMKYVERSERPEWDTIGMLGVLAVFDDGTCEVNGYAEVIDGGIASKAYRYIPNKTYRVVERVADNIVKVVFK